MNWNLKMIAHPLPGDGDSSGKMIIGSILKFLNPIETYPDLASDLSQEFQLQVFQLGNPLSNYRVPILSSNTVLDEQNVDNLYLICEGRVRLLGFSEEKQREVSLGVLETGEIFGLDQHFSNHNLPDRAIAASAVAIAEISYCKLEYYLKQLPALADLIKTILSALWSLGLTASRQYLLGYFSNRLVLTLISGFIRHALSLPLKFFESRRVGDITTRVQENQKIQRFLVSQVILSWLDILMGVIYLGLMFYYNAKLTFLVLALIPPMIILTLAGFASYHQRYGQTTDLSLQDFYQVIPFS